MDEQKIFETADRLRKKHERENAPQTTEKPVEAEKWGYATVGWFIGFITGWIFGDKNK